MASAHLPGFGGRAVRGPPGPHRASYRAGTRTRTSAHLPEFGGGEVRGPPGPHWALCQAGMRTRTSAHLPGSAAARCADLPVRIGLVPGGDADEDVRAPPRIRRRRGARTSRSALGLVPSRDADEDVRAPPRFGGGAVRGPAGPHRVGARRGCGRGRPRTSQVRRRRGARTSRSASGLVPWRDADEDVRAPPRIRRRRGARTSRSALGFVPGRDADEDVRAPPRFGGGAVRGPPVRIRLVRGRYGVRVP